jgi:hypothetical protein
LFAAVDVLPSPAQLVWTGSPENATRWMKFCNALQPRLKSYGVFSALQCQEEKEEDYSIDAKDPAGALTRWSLEFTDQDANNPDPGLVAKISIQSKDKEVVVLSVAVPWSNINLGVVPKDSEFYDLYAAWLFDQMPVIAWVARGDNKNTTSFPKTSLEPPLQAYQELSGFTLGFNDGTGYWLLETVANLKINTREKNWNISYLKGTEATVQKAPGFWVQHPNGPGSQTKMIAPKIAKVIEGFEAKTAGKPYSQAWLRAGASLLGSNGYYGSAKYIEVGLDPTRWSKFGLSIGMIPKFQGKSGSVTYKHSSNQLHLKYGFRWDHGPWALKLSPIVSWYSSSFYLKLADAGDGDVEGSKNYPSTLFTGGEAASVWTLSRRQMTELAIGAGYSPTLFNGKRYTARLIKASMLWSMRLKDYHGKGMVPVVGLFGMYHDHLYMSKEDSANDIDVVSNGSYANLIGGLHLAVHF